MNIKLRKFSVEITLIISPFQEALCTMELDSWIDNLAVVIEIVHQIIENHNDVSEHQTEENLKLWEFNSEIMRRESHKLNNT